MPHLSGRCDCGRAIHLPKDATYGHQWECFKCGKVWTLSKQGKPLHTRGSKAPPAGVPAGAAGCFPAGTFIKTPYGVLDIATARNDGWVLAIDPQSGELRRRRILKVCKHGKHRIWEVGFADGTQLRTTESHTIYVGGAWVQVRQVRAGDIVCCLDAHGEMAGRQVTSSCPTPAVEEVFNLIVEGEFSFIADGVVAHSFSHFRLVRALVWTIYAKLRGWVSAKPSAAAGPACHIGSGML